MNTFSSLNLNMEDLATGNTVVENNKGLQYGTVANLIANT